MKFVYTSHFKFRAKQRRVPFKLAREIFANSKENYLDNLRGHHIKIAKMKFNKKVKTIMLSYDIMNKTIEFITIHPIRDKEVENKISSGRWKYEKN